MRAQDRFKRWIGDHLGIEFQHDTIEVKLPKNGCGSSQELGQHGLFLARVREVPQVQGGDDVRVFWLSWAIRFMDDPEVSDTWPEGVKGWITGLDTGPNGEPRDTWCARVVAESAEDAQEKVLSMYGRFRSEVAWRFEPREHPLGWWPDEGRFPR